MKGKIQNALNEGRILVLGAQVLMGFQLQTVLQPGFDRLPISSQHLKLAGLGLILVALALLMSPAAYHRIVEDRHVGEGFHRFVTRVCAMALLPFALSLSCETYVAAAMVIGRAGGVVFSLMILVMALFFWYGLEALHKGKTMELIGSPSGDPEETEEASLKDRIKFVLTEARMVLPGVQALLGFQFTGVLMDGFDRLPRLLQIVHLGSLGFIAVASIFLMSPAAYHRIAENGEDSERLHRFASRMLLCAMALLAIGVSGDVFVVVSKVLRSATAAGTAAFLTLVVFYGLWFGYSLYRKAELKSSHPRPVTVT